MQWRFFLFKFKNLFITQQIPIRIYYPRENHIFQNGNDRPRDHRYTRDSIVNLLKTSSRVSKFPTRRRKTSPSYHSRNRALQLPTSSISRRTISSSKSLSATVSQTDHPSPSGTTENLSRVIFFPRAISRTFIPPPTYPVGLTAVIYIYHLLQVLISCGVDDQTSAVDLATGSRMQLLNRPRQNWRVCACVCVCVVPRAIPRTRSRDRYYSRRVQSLGDQAPFLFQIWFPRWICFFY